MKTSPESFYESKNKYYDTRAADVWALGVILINMTCGFMPWREALASEHDFVQFTKDPYWLETYLPISSEAIPLFEYALHPDPSKRFTLAELRDEVSRVSRFLMDDDEASFASPSARSKLSSHAQTIGLNWKLPPSFPHPALARTTSVLSVDSLLAPPLAYSVGSERSFVLKTPNSMCFNIEPAKKPRKMASVLSRFVGKNPFRPSS